MKKYLLLILLLLGFLVAHAEDGEPDYALGFEYCTYPFKGEGGNRYKPGFVINLLGMSNVDSNEGMFAKVEMLGVGAVKNVVSGSSNDAIIWDWISMRIGPCYGKKSFKVMPYFGMSWVTYYLERSESDSRKGDSMMPLRAGLALQAFKQATLYGEYVFRVGDDIKQYHSFNFKLDINL